MNAKKNGSLEVLSIGGWFNNYNAL